jgi:hypothetical protein
MSKEWIESLAGELKEKGREGAESYARDQHRTGIIEAQGKVFFMGLVSALEQDFSEIRSQLQGSAISCETTLTRESPTQILMTRGRFPWFDASLKHEGANITLEYVQGRGVPGGQTLKDGTDRRVVSFLFEVDAQDKLSSGAAFGESSQRYNEPESMAEAIVRLLFEV